MNAFLAASIELARFKAARGCRPVRFVHTDGVYHTLATLQWDTDEPRHALADLPADEWIVYPSGLALPITRVNWFWQFPGRRGLEYRLGTADQARRFAERTGVNPQNVNPVPEDFVHDTTIREDGPRSYTFVQSRSFPSWAGV